MLVEDDRLVAVEPFGADLPAGTPVREHAGTLLPGLVDCHVHLVADGTPGSLERAGGATDREVDAEIARSLAAQARGGVTTVRDLGDRGYRTLPFRDAPRPGHPRVVAAGPPVTVPGGHCHYLGGVAGDDGDGVRRAVAERAERGVDLVKVMASGGMLTLGTDVCGVQFGPEPLAALVEEAHRAGLRVTAHAHSLASVRHALAAGVDGLEHFSCLTETGPVTPDDVLAEVAERGVTVCPTLGTDPDRVPPPDQLPAQMRELLARLGLTFEEAMLTRREQLSRARRHGVRVVSGQDSGAAPPKPHGGLHRAVTELVDCGWPVAEALATATSVAADECGVGGVTGRLRPGRAADLLVVDGDVAAEPAALGRPLLVLVRGTPAYSARESPSS